jgi:hypothetical protein
MVTFDCTTSRHDGVTLVTVHLRDIDVPTRVRIDHRLDGPLWPPRREGVPEAGWSDTGFAGVVSPERHTLGYATPAPPADPAATLADAERLPDATPVGELTDDAESVVRHLGDPAPPADAVPAGSAEPDDATADADDTASPTDRPSENSDRRGEQAPPDDALPPAVASWLAEMDRRVAHAVALDRATTVPEATTAVRDAGGMAAVGELADADDERRLRALARRARRLADRRAGVTVPAETLARLT